MLLVFLCFTSSPPYCLLNRLASPFCSFQLQSDHEDRSSEFRMFLIGKCFQVF